MKKIIALLALLPALAWAQGISPPGWQEGKLLANYPFNTSWQMIPEDANTVSHVTFTGAISTNTNLVYPSYTFSAWSRLGGGTGGVPGIQSGDATPDGSAGVNTRIAFSLGAGRTNSDYSLTRKAATAAAGPVTFSAWLKTTGAANKRISMYINSDGTMFSEREVEVTPTWTRYTITASTGTTGGTVYASLGLLGGYFHGDATADIQFWGTQIEVGSSATAYIPTVSGAVTVDRSLYDTKGLAWQMTGTPTATVTDPFTPSRSGRTSFTSGNYYNLDATNVTLGFAGDFTACAVYSGAATLGDYIFQSAAGGNDGWMLYGTGTTLQFYTNAAAGATTVSNETTGWVNGVNVACVGRNGTNQYIKQNLRTTVTSANTKTTVAASGIKVGVGATGLTIYEAYFTSTAWSEANVVEIMNRVFNLYGGGPSALTVTRADVATITPRPADCSTGACTFNMPRNVPRITGDGFLVEPARTNYVLYSQNITNGSTSATVPWNANGTTLATVANGPYPGGSWVSVTSTDYTTQVFYTPAITGAGVRYVSSSALIKKASGTGPAAVWAGCGVSVDVAKCSCLRSDGGTCAVRALETYYCEASVTDLTTTPIRLTAMVDCVTPGTSHTFAIVPGKYGAGGSNGTVLFANPQVEEGTFPTSYIYTPGSTVARPADQISTTNPITNFEWCVTGTYLPADRRPWQVAGYYPMLWSVGSDAQALSAVGYFNTDGKQYLTIFDSVPHYRLTSWTTTLTAGTPARIESCNVNLNPKILVDGALRTGAYTGDAGNTGAGGTATTLYLGMRNDGWQFSGYVKDFKICTGKGAKARCR